MLISVDHGNKQIKTPCHTFTSGLYESSSRPAFGDDILYYKGKYYALSEERIPYMRDKTSTEQFSFSHCTVLQRKSTQQGNTKMISSRLN